MNPDLDGSGSSGTSRVDAAFVRSSFPGLGDTTFLDHAAASPLPQFSIDALVDMGRRLGTADSPNALDYADALRIDIARLINGDPSGVALTRSTAHGIALLSNGLDLAPTDNVIVAEGDYPTAIYPWMARQQRTGLDVRFVRPGNGPVAIDDILEMIDKHTRVVCLAEVMFVSGYRVDIAALGAECRERGIIFCVDAMQSIGAFDIDVRSSNVDVLTSGAVKWLLGPNGVSFCWMRSDLVQQLPPLIPGALTVRNRMDFTTIDPVWAPDAHRFEETWLPLPEMAALRTSISVAREVGFAAIEKGVRANARTLADALVGLGAELRGPWPRADHELSGIVSFSHPNTSADVLAAALARARVKFSRRGDSIRLSPHYYNTSEDLDHAIRAISAAV